MNKNSTGLIKSDLITNLDTAGGSFGIGRLFFYRPGRKSVKFIELAENRVSATLKSFQLLSNLPNKKNYHYPEEQAKQIIDSIEVEVESLKLKFANSNQSRSTELRHK